MIDNYILMGNARQAGIEAAKSIYFAQGRRIQILPPAGDGFPPERSDKIDPETVLKRKRAGMSLGERRALRRMAEEL